MTTIVRSLSVAALLVAARAVAQIPVAGDADLERSVIRSAPQGRYAMYGGLTRLAPGEGNLVGRLRSGSSWTDRTPPPGQRFYRVVARRGGRVMGVSWLALEPGGLPR